MDAHFSTALALAILGIIIPDRAVICMDAIQVAPAVTH